MFNKRNFRFIFWMSGLFFVTAFYNACGSQQYDILTQQESSFDSLAIEEIIPSPVELPNTNCIQGRRLGVWLDSNETGVIRPDNYLGSFIAYKGDKTMKDNYNYYSASAHPLMGPQPQGFVANTFFYEGSDGLSLSFFANIDAGGSSHNDYEIEVLVSNNQSKDKVVLSDDNGELIQIYQNETGSQYKGKFEYLSNTDGGVIGPFVGNDYKIQFRVKNSGDIQSARFYSADGGSFQLKDDKKSVSSFIISYLSYENCL